MASPVSNNDQYDNASRKVPGSLNSDAEVDLTSDSDSDEANMMRRELKQRDRDFDNYHPSIKSSQYTSRDTETFKLRKDSSYRSF